MAITIKCPDCGHTKQSDDGEAETCPECEGTMTPPAKKKYQAKSSTLEEESRAKNKSKPRDADEDERPKKKSQVVEELPDEDEGERPKSKKRSGGDIERNGKAAEQLGLKTGFKDQELVAQVADELSHGEVLHFVCRPAHEIAKKQGLIAIVIGGIVAVLGLVGAVAVLTVLSSKVPWFAALAGLFIAGVGTLIAILGPIMKNRQARLGWYAVTDRRAIVFNIALWGKTGQVEVYEPNELRKMRVKKSAWLKGGGDLIFRTEVHDSRTKWVDRKTGKTVKQTGARTEHHFGFMGIADVKDVELLIHEILLGGRRDEDDDEDE